MVDLIHLAMFGIIFLILIGFVSNTGESFNNIEDQMFLMNCPLPISNGIASFGSPAITGFSLNYTVSYTNATDGTGTFFECTASDGLFGASISTKGYGDTLFSAIPIGFLGYLQDSLTTLFQRIQALFTLISYFVTPANFNILGYTLADIGAFGTFMVVAIYAFCYIVIGIMLYKVISPFSGVG